MSIIMFTPFHALGKLSGMPKFLIKKSQGLGLHPARLLQLSLHPNLAMTNWSEDMYSPGGAKCRNWQLGFSKHFTTDSKRRLGHHLEALEQNNRLMQSTKRHLNICGL